MRFLGHDVRIRTYRPIDGRRNFTGAIGSVSEKSNAIELVTELGPVPLEIDLIEKANLVAHF
jgi:ribosome maturation factor RimP